MKAIKTGKIGISERILSWCRVRRFVVQVTVAVLLALLLPGGVVHGQHGHGHGQDAETMDDLVVTAERISEYAANNPNQVVVMGQEEIQQRNLLSVDEVLNAMAGVDIKRSSGLGSRISIRGSGKSGGVLVLLNGRPLNSGQYGGVDLSGIPIDMVSSITVFKPPVPVWLGAGASQGAISIVTRDTLHKRKEGQKHATRAHAAAGSYGLAECTVSHRANLSSGTVMVSVAGKRRDGKRTNSDRDAGSLTLHWNAATQKSRQMEIDGRFYSSEYGSSGPVDNPTPDARQSYRKASLDSRLSGLMGETGDYAINLYGDLFDLEDKSQSGFISTLDSTKLGVKGEYNWSGEADRWGVRLNTIVEHDDLDHTLSGSHQRNTAGLGVQTDRKWTSLTATLGLRGDMVSDFDINPGYSGGLSYAMADHWFFKVNTGYTVNIPTFGQLYQPSHGSIDQVRGNPDLDKEEVYSSDITFEYRQGKSRLFQASLFRTDTWDTILYQRDIDRIFRPVNGGRSWRHGLEATWKYGFETGLTVDANVIIQDSEVEDTGNEMTYTPKVKLKLTLMYTLKGPGTRLETTIRYCSEQFSEMENREEERLDDYIAVDFKAVQPFKVKTIAAEWFLTVENLFDADYEVHFGYPDDGIRFVSGLNLTF